MRRPKPASPRSFRSYRNSAGQRAGTFGSTFARVRAIPLPHENMRRSWLRFVQTYSSPPALHLWRWFLEVTQTVPIVFCVVVDPIGAGFVEKLSRPGSNVTGFMMFDYSLSGKWVELLKQIAPDVTQVAVLRDPSSPASNWAVCGNPGGGAITWSGSKRDQCERPTRVRPRGHRIRTRAEWRSHCSRRAHQTGFIAI